MEKPTYEELEKKIIQLKKEVHLKTKENLENRYKNLFDFMTEMVQTIELIYDAKGNPIDYFIRDINLSAASFYGKTKSELLDKKATSFIKKIEDYWLNFFDTVAKTGIPKTYENYGIEFDKYYLGTAWKVSKNTISVCYQDITEQKLREKEKEEAKLILDRTKKKLYEAQKLAKIGSWIFNVESQEAEWSEQMFQIWGFDSEKGTPKYDPDIIGRIHKDDLELYNSAFDKAVNSGTPNDFEFRVCIPGKKIKVIRAIWKPILGDNQKIVTLTGTNQDITTQDTVLILAKEKAEESDRLKSMFLANMSHEVRSPMNGILGFTTLLRRQNISEEKRDKFLGIIEHEGHRLLNIISDIVDISKIDSNLVPISMRPCNVNAVIKELHSKYSLESISPIILIKAKVGLKDKDSIIETDQNRLVQILSNLLQNAIKFTNEGVVEFGYSLNNDFLEFYVQDSGPGIEIEDRKAIFGRFNQGKQHHVHNLGSGLGLSIAKGLTELLGGQIWLESEVNFGSTFYVNIPYTRIAMETNVDVKTVPVLINKNEFIILIAEDEYNIFLYMEELLSVFNCQILHANNGKEAVKIFEQNSSIDIILMDINMPLMNGYEAVKKIRETNKEIPIIAQSGLVMTDEKDKALLVGFDDYIPKPISEKLFIKMLNKYLEKLTDSNIR